MFPPERNRLPHRGNRRDALSARRGAAHRWHFWLCRAPALEQASSDGPHAMVRLLARVIGVGTETADMLVQEVLSRNMRNLTGFSALCRPHWLARREREFMPGRKGWPVRAMLGFDDVRFNWPGGCSCSKKTAPWRNGFRPAPRTPAAPARP